MKKGLIVTVLMALCFSSAAKVYIDEDEAPLGLKWGMSFEDFEKNKMYNFKISDSDSNAGCPVKEVILDNMPDDSGEYRLYFYEKFKTLKFSGLYQVINGYETPDINSINKKHSNLRHELNTKYGENKKIYSIGIEGFHTGNIQRFLDVDYNFDKYAKDKNGNYHLVVSYSFYPKEYASELEENIKEIRRLCENSLLTD